MAVFDFYPQQESTTHWPVDVSATTRCHPLFSTGVTHSKRFNIRPFPADAKLAPLYKTPFNRPK